ncbi:MAG: LegC family aminotransferase [Verrucomicrobia bacterium]|nr:LegC family aminotransferase [Verrucomicrobiota bacterium]
MSDTPVYLSYPCLKGREIDYVTECLKSEWVSTSGAYVTRFEQAIADYVGAPGAVACVNGTAALHICLLLAGVKAGDEVLVPTLTFIAAVNAVRYVNAEPVFMDCDDYLNLDVAKVEQFLAEECGPAAQGVIHKRTGRPIRAVIAVHVFGSLCELDRLMAVAERHRLVVIEDATEALGSRMRRGAWAGRHAGMVGDFGCYSFNGNKIITCGGGGMIVARSAQALARAKYLTTQAKDDPLHYVHHEVGYNYRLTALQAAMGLAQLEQLPGFIQRKRAQYLEYKARLAAIPGLRLLDVPDYGESNHWLHSLVIEEARYGLGRDLLRQKFAAARIETRPIWTLNHTQRPYRHNRAYRIEKAPFYFDRVLNIPSSAGLTDEEFERVMEVLRRR